MRVAEHFKFVWTERHADGYDETYALDEFGCLYLLRWDYVDNESRYTWHEQTEATND